MARRLSDVRAGLFLRTVYLKSVRDARVAIACWGVGLGLIVLSGASVYPTDPAKRAAFVSDVQKTAASLSALGLGDTVGLDTLGGFVAWRILAFFPIFLGIWGVVAGSGMIRGEEQRGRLDVLLSLPRGRARVLVSKVLAYVTAVALALVIAWVIALAGLAGNPLQGEFAPDAAAVALLNTAVTALVFAALAVLLAQVAGSRRAAASGAGVLLASAFLGNNLSGTVDALKALRFINPFYYYNQSKPFTPAIGTDWAAIGGQAVACVVFVALAGLLFVRRDIGQPFRFFGAGGGRQRTQVRPTPAAALARARSFLPGGVFGLALRDLRGSILLWGAGLAVYEWLIFSSAKTVQANLLNTIAGNPTLSRLIRGDLAFNAGYLNGIFFGYTSALLTLYGLTIVAGWGSDQEEGRLEVTLAAPVARGRVVVARLAAAGVAVAAVLLVGYVALLGFGAAYDFTFDAGNGAWAMALLWPIIMCVVAFGYALADWLARPGAAWGIAGGVLLAVYLLYLLGPLFDAPAWLLDLSIFTQYGTPILNGVVGAGPVALFGEVVALAAVGVVGFVRRDIVK